MINEIIFVLLTVLVFKTWIDLLRDEAIFVPLPKKTIRKILRAAKISNKDFLVDLGCGDGRVVIIAAKEFGAKCVGVEKNFLLAKIANWMVEKEGLKGRVKIVNKDFFKVDLRKFNVVFAYLSKKVNAKIESKLKKELKKGSKVLSAAHEFKSFKLEKKIKTGHFYSYIYRV